jgi:hypothetical protein
MGSPLSPILADTFMNNEWQHLLGFPSVFVAYCDAVYVMINNKHSWKPQKMLPFIMQHHGSLHTNYIYEQFRAEAYSTSFSVLSSPNFFLIIYVIMSHGSSLTLS